MNCYFRFKCLILIITIFVRNKINYTFKGEAVQTEVLKIEYMVKAKC